MQHARFWRSSQRPSLAAPKATRTKATHQPSLFLELGANECVDEGSAQEPRVLRVLYRNTHSWEWSPLAELERSGFGCGERRAPAVADAQGHGDVGGNAERALG